MKIAVINDNRLAIVQEGRVFDVSESVSWDCNNVQGSLVRLMKEFYQLKPTLESAVNQAQGYPLEEVKLRAPVPAPSKIWAAPVNYLNHQSEMNAHLA